MRHAAVACVLGLDSEALEGWNVCPGEDWESGAALQFGACT